MIDLIEGSCLLVFQIWRHFLPYLVLVRKFLDPLEESAGFDWFFLFAFFEVKRIESGRRSATFDFFPYYSYTRLPVPAHQQMLALQILLPLHFSCCSSASVIFAVTAHTATPSYYYPFFSCIVFRRDRDGDTHDHSCYISELAYVILHSSSLPKAGITYASQNRLFSELPLVDDFIGIYLHFTIN